MEHLETKPMVSTVIPLVPFTSSHRSNILSLQGTTINETMSSLPINTNNVTRYKQPTNSPIFTTVSGNLTSLSQATTEKIGWTTLQFTVSPSSTKTLSHLSSTSVHADSKGRTILPISPPVFVETLVTLEHALSITSAPSSNATITFNTQNYSQLATPHLITTLSLPQTTTTHGGMSAPLPMSPAPQQKFTTPSTEMANESSTTISGIFKGFSLSDNNISTKHGDSSSPSPNLFTSSSTSLSPTTATTTTTAQPKFSLIKNLCGQIFFYSGVRFLNQEK